ncbi:glutathione S-transferase [Marinomonas hwangdonensis]|uniref:Glutathione S-transferase n=1 Tax=Marinomonas hwangdonensis TaxID=1053647 RepID=A0A3M8Q9M0_9GAMM|nr:glutathione S-transferase [Marinomonas hwangdonensis]RNF52778.1 glutathione S-transferase [Marinomonas hwangdonensis]
MLPVLYSFRRCPYAIRARYMIALLQEPVYLREVVLKAKPPELLALGGRSSVPQLVDMQGTRYPESLDIMYWALSRAKDRTLAEFLYPISCIKRHKIASWVAYNDHFFKYWLVRYKYADRYPEGEASDYRARAERFLRRLEGRLSQRVFLLGDTVSLADIAVFPFIRQFAGVDQAWFEAADYPFVQAWLRGFTHSSLFNQVVMVKHPAWLAGQEEGIYPASLTSL